MDKFDEVLTETKMQFFETRWTNGDPVRDCCSQH